MTVHIWSADLRRAPDLRMLMPLLSEDERARAERFHFAADRQRSIVARWLTRKVLGEMLSTRPEKLRLSANPYGKPFLVSNSPSTDLRFNLSHSADLVLLAVTERCDVGVDVEKVRPDVEAAEVAASFFSSNEVASLNSLPPATRTQAFFRCWTRKEAYLKARGQGLSVPLDSFTVTVRPVEPAALISAADEPGEASKWSLIDLLAGSDYAAALALEGSAQDVAWHEA